MGRNMMMIYVIDDDESVRKAAVRLLTAIGLPVLTFASGLEFLASIHPADDDCLVIDIHMPGMGGLELQQRLLQTGVRPVVIFTSAVDDERARWQARQAGAFGFFLKPFDGQALLDTISFAISGSRA